MKSARMRTCFVAISFLLASATTNAQKVKTNTYEKEHTPCIKTFHMATGRVLTSRGLIEDPQVNQIMHRAVSAQMSAQRVAETKSNPDIEIRFIGGASADIQTEYHPGNDYAVWNIGGYPYVAGRTYKKSVLGIAAVDAKSNKTIWSAQCVDNFGDPKRIEERINNAVAKAFSKFPKSLFCQ
jgi:Domain of unknown function (DUF4136)